MSATALASTPALTAPLRRRHRPGSAEPRGVIFRLDDVVLPTRALYFRAWSEALGAALEGFRHGEMASSYFMREPDFDSNRSARPLTEQEYESAIFERDPRAAAIDLLRLRGVSVHSDPLLEQVIDPQQTVLGIILAMDEAVKAQIAIDNPIDPELLHLMGDLHSEGFQLAVTTPSEHALTLAKRSFDVYFFTDEIVSAKGPKTETTPAEDPLLIPASNQLRIVPERLVVFESTPSGILAANAGGFARAVGIAPTDEGRERLRRAGADELRSSAGEVTADEVIRWVEEGRGGRQLRTN